ncbi:hypothetical protein Q3G72_006508 [Acer saccharum]|nr:hypothetical protein Q3G72_006508 [Acer saccharum]
MDIWSEQSQISSLNKISWIEVYGVPLNCWCDAFFKKVRGKVGEVLWIDEKTESKKRLDCGQIMVLASVEAQLSCEVSVRMGIRSFPVKFVEHQAPVTDEWVNKVLGLKPCFSNLNEGSDKEIFDKALPFIGKNVSYAGDCKLGRGREGVREKGMGKRSDRMDFREDVRETSSSPKLSWEKAGGDRVFMVKVKEQCLYNKKPTCRLPRPTAYGAVKIDKKMVTFSESSSDGSGSSELGSKFDFGPVLNQKLYRGECSNRRLEKRKTVSGLSDGPKFLLNKILSNKEERKRSNGVSSVSDHSSRDVSNSGSTDLDGEKDGIGCGAGHSVGAVQNSYLMSRVVTSVQMVLETQMTNNQGIDIIVDLGNCGNEEESLECRNEEKVAEVNSEKEEAVPGKSNLPQNSDDIHKHSRVSKNSREA